MVKRILILLCALLFALPAARAESPLPGIADAIYRIVLRTESGDVPLGTGLLFAEQDVLITAEGCCAEGSLYAIGSDGEHAIRDWAAAESAGVALMEMATPSTATPAGLASSDAQGLPFLLGADHGGNLASVPLYTVRHGMHRGQYALVLSGAEGLLPGALMMDAEGQLVGLVLAQQAEGVGNYIALDAAEIYRAMFGDEEDTAGFLDLTVRWEGGLLTVSWADETREGGVYIVTLSGAENNYYTTYEIEPGEKDVLLAVPPGHTYYLQAQWAEIADAALPPVWAAMDIYTVPEGRFTAYGFTQDCYLASIPAGSEPGSVLPRLESITAAALADQNADLYLQVHNVYDVSDVIEVAMSVELIAPDGQFFYEELGYTFAPEYEQDDSFPVPVGSLFEDCAEFSGGQLLPGEYRLRYALDGQVAGEFAFVLK